MTSHAYKASLDLIPPHMHEGVIGHVEHGREVGGFLTKLLEGDETAWVSADRVNLAFRKEWGEFIDKHLPPACHGSPLKVAAWRKMGGLDGLPDGD